MVLVTVRAQMKHLLPRAILSVDPHLQVDDAVVLRLTRHQQSLPLDLSVGDHVFAVVPSSTAATEIRHRIQQSGFVRPEVGRTIHVDDQVECISIAYRPFPIQAWMTRRFIRTDVVYS